jgi:hypothetical protein
MLVALRLEKTRSTHFPPLPVEVWIMILKCTRMKQEVVMMEGRGNDDGDDDDDDDDDDDAW